MSEDELDVKASEPSAEEEISDEDLEKELMDEESKPEVEESKETDVKEAPEPSEEQEKVELDSTALQERLKKAEEEKENLKKALQDERTKKRVVQAPLSTTPSEPTKVDSDTYVKALIAEEEKAAMKEIYADYPELTPENDPDNTVYNDFAKRFAVAAQGMGITPVKKEHFLEIGRMAMAIKTGKIRSVEDEKAKARAEGHREALKADAANIGGTSVASKPERQEPVTDADRRAAKAAGMDLKSYLKNKNVYDDGIPI